ncbi:competence protein ComEC [Natronincola peptidivorans]|uniref:Competence protein ComEC n=1 Tax=Natronincola peptidivorans TaxID=426128 RepID=A0A1I0ECA1_9FIRM|nr:ComEC/Rec2 family competence protein [Natronincola peptidivorans]SET42087.1 competence protein ComEC [Natronincola peptidivorans]
MISRKQLLALFLVLFILIPMLSGCFFEEDTALSIHVIDVGQGDSILIKTPNGKTMLIDGGEPAAGKTVVSYLKKRKVKKIDLLVATHPHADHIGGLIDVIHSIPIDKFYMPHKLHTSKTFENLLDAAKDKDLKISAATAGIMIDFDEDITLYFLGPLRDYGDDLNLWSAVVKMDYKEKSFLFTGDLEALGEEDILSGFQKDFLKSQFLKVGHHGSRTSTTENFLQVIEPTVAVISCGRNNSYGHPHEEVINRLNLFNIAVYRTDMQGTIVIKSDGNRIWSHQKPYYH